jgi:VWFA-related protein
MSTQLHRTALAVAAFVATAVVLHGQQGSTDRGGDRDNPFRFKSGVELINVTATVSDSSGRFVSGLRQEDFTVYEDDVLQTVTHFSAERVPVSLGIALDTSGSMAGEKIQEAQSALDRFLYDLNDPDDEFFLYRFSNNPVLLQGWTDNRQLISRALGRLNPNGGTAMYDTVAEALPLVAQGKNQKKALLIISDGNDTTSRIGSHELKQRIRESELLVYAIGIDGEYDEPTYRPNQPRMPPRNPIPLPFPFPPGGGRFPGGRRPGLEALPQFGGPGGQGGWRGGLGSDRVNVVALRELTDDSGGRTEVVREARDLNPATTSIADELSKQYYLGYPASGKRDGKWHSIRVEVRDRSYKVRARRGYVAS